MVDVYIVYLLGFLEGEGEVVSPVLCLQTVPVKVVWVEDVDQSAEGQAIVPTRGEVSHGNLEYGNYMSLMTVQHSWHSPGSL